ncbi:hypothetical protein EQP59_03795 [Ornithobacterium rhinotracheale]|uniref:Uncharacterized protein n=1 Tax=Ornithobacterium rhinotracheale TaxID=28251 RepID=A0A410JR97_ORNRH|nr:hypothetical protein [Ornithobacterium rhinotracheale]QAR30538.1 hypothetical protein EQP59_03795 [Ornithobacterium rhinotracheale]
MENKLIMILEEINFTSRYIALCNKFSDFNNGINFSKQEILNCLINNNIQMKFIPKEKLFFKDYFINDITIRFLFEYKYGCIDCRYWIFKNEDTVFNGSFREVSLVEDKGFNEKVSYRFPIATSLHDLQEILKKIIELNSDFIIEFKREVLKLSSEEIKTLFKR